MNATIHDPISKSDKRPKGRVQIFEKQPDGDLKLIDTNNLVVYMGRNWLMQRAFNQSGLTQGSPGVNTYISWFGVGTGGTTANILTPLQPQLTDDELYTPVIINADDPACANDGFLHPFDNIVYEEDPENQSEYLIASITTTIGENDANGPHGVEGCSAYYDLSEAGLYISNSHMSNSFDPASKKLFARVTFSTIRKFLERQLVFVWKIYF